MSSVPSMQRGHGGRIEEAFAACKERNEAAFVTFVTAGFPVKEGEEGEDETNVIAFRRRMHLYTWHGKSSFFLFASKRTTMFCLYRQ